MQAKMQGKTKANAPMTPVTLDSSIAIKLTMGSKMLKERALMARNDAWHRIKIIRGARFEKEVVLRAILAAVEPADLIPVRYQANGDDTYFMARNCGPALEMLCRSNLIINLPSGDPVVVVATLAFASIHDLKINIQPILLSALTKRYDTVKKNLNLFDFHRDNEIAKTVHCPLSQIRTLSHTLKLAKTALGPFEHLNLQKNELVTLSALENSNLTSLRGLDLRYNYLSRMDALAALKGLTITELWLDGNPVCENYSTAGRYVESAKRYCPNLAKLDGVTLDLPGLPLTYNNYFRNEDTRKLVEQFTTHFFGLYDNDRPKLRDLYHKNAVYSLTLGVSQTSTNRKNLGVFIGENRNILQTDEITRENLLYRGREDIMETLRRMPHTKHDRSNFRCDVAYQGGRCVLVSVEGVFKMSNIAPNLLAFGRTFLLVGSDNNEFNIVNDQYHIDAAVVVSPTSFDDGAAIELEIREPRSAPREKERLIFTMMDVTTMNTEWCHRFLEDAKWDAKKAIRRFMNSYESSKIPPEAFDK